MPASASTVAGDGAVIQLQRHVLAQNPSEHVGHVADDFVHVQALGLDDLAAAEGEQLAGQPGRALGGLRDLLRGTRGRVIQLGHRQQRGVAVNDGEDVVEIVRDAAGKLADGLHFLRLAQLFLQPSLRGDIAEQAQHEQRPAVDFDKRIAKFPAPRSAVVQDMLPLPLSARWPRVTKLFAHDAAAFPPGLRIAA